jgi:Domain of unknown function (DUF4158)
MTVADDPTASKRLRILEPGEIDALYARPTFTPDERSLSFSLTAPERAALSVFRSLPSQLAFILQLGYFKAKRLFFPIVFTDVADDVAAVLTRHFPQSLLGDWPPPSKPTILKHRRPSSASSSTVCVSRMSADCSPAAPTRRHK